MHQLEAQVALAQAQLAQAELNLEWTKVRAPQDGWVTKRNVDKGNYVQVGQSVMALVTPDVWVTANFKEDQLDRMRPGDRVDIDVDAFPDLHLEGHVDSIQLGSGSRFSAFPAENATGNFVKIVQRVPVKIVIDSGLDPNHAAAAGDFCRSGGAFEVRQGLATGRKEGRRQQQDTPSPCGLEPRSGSRPGGGVRAPGNSA